MITTVTRKNMISIPAELGRIFGISPGCRLDWEPVLKNKEIRVRIIPKRGDLAKRLRGSGMKFSPDRKAVQELIAERSEEG